MPSTKINFQAVKNTKEFIASCWPNKRPMSITSWKQIYYNIIKMKTQTAKSRLARKELWTLSRLRLPIPGIPFRIAGKSAVQTEMKRGQNKKKGEKWQREHFVAKTQVTNGPHYTLKSKGTFSYTKCPKKIYKIFNGLLLEHKMLIRNSCVIGILTFSKSSNNILRD